MLAIVECLMLAEPRVGADECRDRAARCAVISALDLAIRVRQLHAGRVGLQSILAASAAASG
jgi:hypothetical protein